MMTHAMKGNFLTERVKVPATLPLNSPTVRQVIIYHHKWNKANHGTCSGSKQITGLLFVLPSSATFLIFFPPAVLAEDLTSEFLRLIATL